MNHPISNAKLKHTLMISGFPSANNYVHKHMYKINQNKTTH